jgi:N-sulfoglucosamine sulfohydrolase
MRYLPIIPIAFCASGLISHAANSDRPNFLFVISDDQSWPYASAYGTDWVKTPGFDRVAKKGILFNNAFVTSPGSSPSRASILTGRYPWQIEEAGTHGSSFPTKYKAFTQVLEENGYLTGFTGKPWGPGDWEVSGWKQNPAGKEYNQKKLKPEYSGISNVDYAANFDLFLKERKEGQPFFFWFGANEPHRAFEKGSGLKEMKDEMSPRVPDYLPDIQIVKQDLLDYAVEIEWFDKQLVKFLDKLKEIGELENTLIIVTGDNGMPFPRGKANCYDAGIHVPLAICWGSKIPESQISDDLISMVDIAPTILEAAGLKFNGAYPMTGRSVLNSLVAKKFKNNISAQEIFAGRERHSSARYDNRGYPQRIIRTDKYLFIRNYHPEYWPAGDPQVYMNDSTLGEMHQAYLDIDDSPTLAYYRKTNIKDKSFLPLFLAAVDKRPAEELYDIIKDPYCMENLAGKPDFEDIRKQLSTRLVMRLKETGDPRESGSNPEIWETYPRLRGEIRKFPFLEMASTMDGLTKTQTWYGPGLLNSLK